MFVRAKFSHTGTGTTRRRHRGINRLPQHRVRERFIRPGDTERMADGSDGKILHASITTRASRNRSRHRGREASGLMPESYRRGHWQGDEGDRGGWGQGATPVASVFHSEGPQYGHVIYSRHFLWIWNTRRRTIRRL
jgi:hypothetical protein